MIPDTIHNLPSEAYHNEAPYNEYLSSSQLKLYSKSPKAAHYAMGNPATTEDSAALRIGKLFHLAMEKLIWGKSIDAFWESLAIFQPPVNSKTQQPYGLTTKAYTEAYLEFLGDESNKDKVIATMTEAQLVGDMVSALVNSKSDAALQMRKFLHWGKPEVSHFVEYNDCKLKYRPDLETKTKIVDYKTVATDDLSERNINSIIAKFGYDISAAFYLFLEHERTGRWKTFYWVFVSKQPPHDCVIVDATNWTYKPSDSDPDIFMPQVGAIKMKSLLDLHIQCKENNEWPGAEIFIPKDEFGHRIMTPTPPKWEYDQATDLMEKLFNNE